MEEIEIAVCDYLSISQQLIRSRTRKADVVKARFFCWYFIYKNLNWTFDKIGKEYGYDHSSVGHAIKTTELGYELYEEDKKTIRGIWVNLKYKLKVQPQIGQSKYRELVSDMIKYDLLSFCKLMTSHKDRTWIYKDLEISNDLSRKIEIEMEKREEQQKKKDKDSINKTKGNNIGESKRQQIKPQTDGEDTIGVRR